MDPLRDALIVEHLGLIEPIALRLSRRIPLWLQVDLIAAGHLGLVQAADTFKPGKAPFSYWARIRIRQSMIEEIRREARQQGLETHDRRTTAPREPAAVLDEVFASPPVEELENLAQLPLAAAIELLTPLQKQVVDLMYQKSMSIWQIRQANLLDVGWRQVERAHMEALASLREELVVSLGVGDSRDYLNGHSMSSPKQAKEPISNLAAAIDELGEIDKKLDKLSELVARRTQLHLMLVEGLKLKPEQGVMRTGAKFSVTITAQALRRFVKDKPQVVKYLGLALYLENDVFGVGKADELLSAVQRAEVIDSACTGPRTYETLRLPG